MRALPKVDPKRWRALLAHWAAADAFDGLRGSLPDWIPKFRRQEFSAARARVATCVIAQNVSLDVLVDQIRRAAANPSVDSIALLMQAKMQRWSIYELDLLTLVDTLYAVSVGERQGLAYLIGEDVADSVIGEKDRHQRLKANATKPRPRRHALPDKVVKEVAELLRTAGISSRQIEAAARRKLEEKGLVVPTKPTLRAQLTRLGFREAKES